MFIAPTLVQRLRSLKSVNLGFSVKRSHHPFSLTMTLSLVF
ncbi:hypothetical protein MJ1HA_1296 [Metallosphaera sedula]|nr:hypothetical protein MJ1HA_1296 [Metallosphaera sedula]